MNTIQAIILGLVEGFTEFLPISSTAHLILTTKILGLTQTEFIKTFEIAIQAGAIFAVIAVYWKKFLDMEILKRVIVAFIPTAIIGLLLYKLIRQSLIGNISVVLWALAIGGVLIIILELYFTSKWKDESGKKGIKTLTYVESAIIGVAQAIAIIPGVSRSATTIIGGLLLGMSRMAIVEFSFLLAVPTIVAASGYDLLKNMGSFVEGEMGLFVVGFISAFITALLGIKFLLKYIQSRTFIGFGLYRILIVALFLLVFL